MEDLRAVREHGGSRLPKVELPRIDLGDVGDEAGFVVTGALQDLEQATKEIVVRDRLEIRVL
jgi:hypothetical protein